MSFVHTTIGVRDMEESLRFYTDIVGLKIATRFPVEGGEIVFLGEGPTKLELIYYENEKEVNLGKDISIGFKVDCLDETLDFIKESGLQIHSGPIQPNPNTRFFFLLDPNGLKVQFIETK